MSAKRSGSRAAAAERKADAALAAAGGSLTVGPVEGNAVAAIQARIDEAAAGGGGVVTLAPGHAYEIDGTISLRSRVTLDLNQATLTAVDNAAFEEREMGSDLEDPEVSYNPAVLKPMIALLGTDEEPIVDARVVNGTIDGNGYNQPDAGCYANVAVDHADDCRVDVTSLRARPGITINLPNGGANTGRRAFCLLVARARRTNVRGVYSDAGYDTIGLRQGATDTLLEGVSASKATKGAIQIAGGKHTMRTKIVGGVYDNTDGGTDASHAFFCHSAVLVDVIGATLRANTGSCVAIFGDTSRGLSREIAVNSTTLDHDGAVPMINITTAHVDGVTFTGVQFRKSGSMPVFQCIGGGKRVTVRGLSGESATASTVITANGVQGLRLTDLDIQSASTGNPGVSLTNCAGVVMSGSIRQAGGVSIHGETCTDVTLSGYRPVAADGPRFVGGSSNIDVLDCDLSGITNANKMRLYGPDSGRVRGNRGVPTESSGVATIPAASTSVTVTHGLWAGTNTTANPRVDRLWAPRDFQVSLSGDPGEASLVWVSAVTPTQVTFTTDAAPGGSGASIVWAARMDRTV